MNDLTTKAREGRMNALKTRAGLGAPVGGTRLRLVAWSDVPAFTAVRRVPGAAFLG